MSYYDIFGFYFDSPKNKSIDTVDTINESFTNINCVDNDKVFDCKIHANNYKSCFIDGKNKHCCQTCNNYLDCNDKSKSCNSLINNPNMLNELGLCKDSTWQTCCASCYAKLNNNILSSNTQMPLNNTQMHLNNTQMPLNNTQMPLNNTQMPLNNTQMPINNTQMHLNNTQMPLNNTQMPLNLLPDCQNYLSSCSQDDYEGSLMKHFCNNTCSNNNNSYTTVNYSTDNISNCKDYINQCSNSDLIGSTLRNYYCPQTCRNVTN